VGREMSFQLAVVEGAGRVEDQYRESRTNAYSSTSHEAVSRRGAFPPRSGRVRPFCGPARTRDRVARILSHSRRRARAATEQVG